MPGKCKSLMGNWVVNFSWLMAHQTNRTHHLLANPEVKWEEEVKQALELKLELDLERPRALEHQWVAA